jgi:hypothetical protein
MTTPKPSNEIAVRFGKDCNGCVIVVFYEAHGEMQTSVQQANLPVKAGGQDAIRLTGKVGELVKDLRLTRKPFVANGHTYYSYSPAQVGSSVNVLA